MKGKSSARAARNNYKGFQGVSLNLNCPLEKILHNILRRENVAHTVRNKK